MNVNKTMQNSLEQLQKALVVVDSQCDIAERKLNNLEEKRESLAQALRALENE